MSQTASSHRGHPGIQVPVSGVTQLWLSVVDDVISGP